MTVEPVILSGARTPIGRLGGALRRSSTRLLGATAAATALERAPGVRLDSVLVGSVLQGGGGQNPARGIAYDAGVPLDVPAVTVNDVCLAGMSTVRLAAMAIRLGESRAALVGGADSMTGAPHATWIRTAPKAGDVSSVDLMIRDGLHCAIGDEGMGPLSDATNARLGISRADQDDFAFHSHRRAAAAIADGLMVDEVVAMSELAADEGVRSDVDRAAIAALPPAFGPEGTITAGNASQLSDGASMGVLAHPAIAAEIGIDPLAVVVGGALVAGPDTSLHLKPADAVRVLLDRHGLTPSDIGLWEINEAYAGVVLASQRELGIDLDIVNVNGGAIALGHPLGGSAFRLVFTLALEMRRRGVRLGVAALCGGGGQGEAILLRLPE